MKRHLLSIITCAALTAPLFAADDTPPAPPPVDVAMTTDTTTGKSKELEFKVKLRVGWNMVAIPGYRVYQVKDIIGNGDYVSSVFNFDPSVNNYSAYSNTGASSTLPKVTTLVPGVGYWVKALKPFMLVFKTNIPSSMANYERAAFVPAATDNVQNFSDAEMGAPIPIVTVGYDDSWDSTTGKLKTDLSKSEGSTDWKAIDPKNYSKTDWSNQVFSFDFHILIDKRFTDQDGRSFQFRPNPNDTKTGIVEIKASTTTAAARSLRETVTATTTAAPTTTAASPSLIGGRFFVDQKGQLVIQMPGAVDLVFAVVDIKEDRAAGKMELQLKNIANSQPQKWTLTHVYNPKIMAWMDAASLVKQDSLATKDEALKYVDWDKLSTNTNDTSMDFLDKGFVPRDFCGNPLVQRKDGTYPFPGDADFPSKDKCAGQGPAASTPAPLDCKGNPLPKKADGTYPFPGDPEFPTDCQPKNGGIVAQPVGQAPLDCQGKPLPKKPDGTYPKPTDPEFPAYCKAGSMGVMTGTISQPNGGTQPMGAPLDCHGNPLPKKADGTYPKPGDVEFPKDCAPATATQPTQQMSAPLDCKGRPLPKKPDGTYPMPTDPEFPADCKFTAPTGTQTAPMGTQPAPITTQP